MKIIITESQYKFLKRRWELYEPLVKREMRDQEPCWYKRRFEVKGFQRYYETVKDSISELIFYDHFSDDLGNVPEEVELEFNEMVRNELDSLIKDMVKDYYDSYNCDDYPNL